MQIVAARSAEHWDHAARLLLAYERESAVALGHPAPTSADEVRDAVRAEVTDPASVFTTYFLAFEGPDPVGGTGVLHHDESSVAMARCFVLPPFRRRGVARAFTAAVVRHAERLDALRVVVEVPASRPDAVEVWRHMGFVDAEPADDGRVVHLERPLDA